MSSLDAQKWIPKRNKEITWLAENMKCRGMKLERKGDFRKSVYVEKNLK